MTILLSLAFIVAAVYVLARKAEDAAVAPLRQALTGGSRMQTGRVDFAALQHLPPPVLRYFRKVLTDGQPLIAAAELTQRGTLRTSLEKEKWLKFSAREFVVPRRRGFLWDASVRLPLGLRLRIVDAYVNGIGLGRLSFMSALQVARETGGAQLSEGELHRYLAEAVWFPTALLPECGVQWTAIDDRSALATLADFDTSVALVFHFNLDDEVCSVESDGRWRKLKAGYQRQRWEGRFRDYRVTDGMRVPAYGEAGWYQGEVLELVWKGHIDAFRFE